MNLHIFVDRCSIEVFSNEGKTVLSALIFPDTRHQELEVYADGGAVMLHLDLYALKKTGL